MNRGTQGIGGQGRKKRVTYGTAESTTPISVSQYNTELLRLRLTDAEPGLYFVQGRVFGMPQAYYTSLAGTITLQAGSTWATSDPRSNGGERVLSFLHVHRGGDLLVLLSASPESGTVQYGATNDARFAHRILTYRVGDY